MSAKIDLKFIDCQFPKDSIRTIEDNGVIFIEVINEGLEAYISLDKSTAIKFAKTLRTEINKIQ